MTAVYSLLTTMLYTGTLIQLQLTNRGSVLPVNYDVICRNFEPKHLAQIKTVYPESYTIRQEKGLVSTGIRSNKYQMTVEARLTGNYLPCIIGPRHGQSTMGLTSFALLFSILLPNRRYCVDDGIVLLFSADEKDTAVTKRKDGRPVFSGNDIVKRKETFRTKLFHIVKAHHQVWQSYRLTGLSV